MPLPAQPGSNPTDLQTLNAIQTVGKNIATNNTNSEAERIFCRQDFSKAPRRQKFYR